MQTNTQKTNTTDTTTDTTLDQVKYIPTLVEWGKLYAKWSEKIASALHNHGNREECREAVHEAFLKAMGHSDHLHLEKPLTPKSDKNWYSFLKYQAMGVLSNYHRRAKYFVPITEWQVAEETFDKDDWGDVDDSDTFAVNPAIYQTDTRWMKAAVRQTFKDACRTAGVSARNIQAFERFILDDLNGQEVVKRIPAIQNTNNLYQIIKRIMNLLKRSSDHFNYIHDEVVAA